MGRSDALLLIISIALAGVIFIELGSSSRDNPASESQPAQVETEPARVRPPEPIVQDLLATTLARPLFDRTRRPLNTSSSENVAERDLPAVGTRTSERHG